MWSTRDVLLMTITVATIAVIMTVLANRKLNSIVDSRVNEKSLSATPMLSVLGNLNTLQSVKSSQPIQSDQEEIPTYTNADPDSHVEQRIDTEPQQQPQKAPQGSGEKWTPL